MANKGGKTILQRLKLIRNSREQTEVLLVGAAGAGKSSLINSLISLIDHGETTHEASFTRYIPTAPEDHMGGHTLLREPVEITEFINIIDNRGWHDWDNEAAVQELVAQINGQRGFDDVDWEGNSNGASFQGGDKVSCLCVVINGEGGTDSLLGFTRLIQTCYSCTGRRPLVVLTHKDKMTEEAIQAIETHLQSTHGVTTDRVFCVQNGDSFASLQEASKLRLLDFLDSCVADGISGRRFHKRKETFNAKAEVRQKEQAEKELIHRQQQNQEAIKEAAQEVELLKSVQEKHKMKRYEENDKIIIQIGQDMKKEEFRKLEIHTESEAALAKLDEISKREEIKQKLEKAKTLAEIEESIKRTEGEKRREILDLEKELRLDEHKKKQERETALTKLDERIKEKAIEKHEAMSSLEREIKEEERNKQNVEVKKLQALAKLEKQMKEDERSKKQIELQQAKDLAEIEKKSVEEERKRSEIQTQKERDIAELDIQSKLETSKQWRENYVDIQNKYLTNLAKEKAKNLKN